MNFTAYTTLELLANQRTAERLQEAEQDRLASRLRTSRPTHRLSVPNLLIMAITRILSAL